MRPSAKAVVGSALALSIAAPAAALPAERAVKAGAPVVRLLVVTRDGQSAERSTRATRTRVRVQGKSCAVGTGTALAALVRSRVDRAPGLRDFGSCSRRARDAGGLYVLRLGTDAGAGQHGWVYKVGSRLATAGAGDPAGPFGRGPLRRGARVTWFYCRHTRRGCQGTLALRVRRAPDGAIEARVRAHDDRGRARAVPDALISGSAPLARTDARGRARIELASGSHRLHAEAEGLVRSFSEAVVVP